VGVGAAHGGARVRIAIADVQVPFLRGGAELLSGSLQAACREAGHECEIVTQPFRFAPPGEIHRAMAHWADEDFSRLSGYTPDLTIALRFPAYGVQAPRKALWLLHQHRAAYDLWDRLHATTPAPPEEVALREDIHRFDLRMLAAIDNRCTISANVSARLRRFTGLDSRPVHPPPALESRLHAGEPEPYVFLPSRFETLKRQSLLIEAMRHVRSPVGAILAGTGGQLPACRELVAKLGLESRVRLLGPVDDEQLIAFYASSFAVFFGPVDEDYGYVTLEAMIAAKPVVTCTDSGGPTEFVVDGETGRVVEPEPRAVAEAIDTLWSDRARAARMGEAGRERHRALGITWPRALEALLAPGAG